MKYRLVLLLLASSGGPALADTPLPPPAQLTVCSPAGTFCATSDPARNVTLVISNYSSKVLWSIPCWHRSLFVSDDGESVVVRYDGMNLVPEDVTLEQRVLFFYNRGKLVRTIRLGDLYQRKSQLERTVSHFAWGDILGFNRSNQLIVELVDGKKVAFAAKTGLIETLRPDGI